MGHDDQRLETVTASEIANFVFCPESWRLRDGLQLPPGNRPALAAGTRHHEAKATAERVAGGSISLGRVLIVIAVILAVALWLLTR
ncbi:hypothetical protein [Tautonia plasticadhaerens]|uniref:PD-(D/E)XK nuclease superfamily protein n=1 Tax=Tautonia plasticadhaerens TaxID=2527974 RepID=A0A518H218_9BACT|nr:hypothetical protein [Tautonia plasticadhaerens]QDV34877.1 hypothetical protein ElP_27740 [Tautonia plasticadhaerens]